MKILSLLAFASFPLFSFSQSVDTSEVILKVDSLIQLSRKHTEQRDFEKAREMNQEAEQLVINEIGFESATYGIICFNRGRILDFEGAIEAAESWYLQARALQQRILGEKHLDYAMSLNNLGGIYHVSGDYEQAELNYTKALSIRREILGEKHYLVAVSLLNLANIYLEKGRYAQAESYYLESRELLKDLRGSLSADYALCLSNLSSLYWQMGAYETSEDLSLESIAINEKIWGKTHPQYASSLNNLVTLYWTLGKWDKAEELYLIAIDIFKEAEGYESSYAICLSNLAILYNDMGRFEESEFLFLEAMKVGKELWGENHQYTASQLDNLAGLYYDLGNYQKGKKMLQKATAIRENTLGKTHIEYAKSLQNLALFSSALGFYPNAEAHHLESLTLLEEIVGKEHYEYAKCLSDLAGLYVHQKQWEKASVFYTEALEIYAANFGEEHLHYIYNLLGLGGVYMEMDKDSEAEYCLKKARTVLKKVVGKEHPDYLTAEKKLAAFYIKKKNYQAATACLQNSNEQERTRLLKATRHLSEKELFEYREKFVESQHEVLSFIQLGCQLTETAYNNALFYKGFLLNTHLQSKQLLGTNAIVTEIYNDLQAYHRRLAAEYVKPVIERQGVVELEEKINAVEKELARTVAGYSNTVRQLSWQEVQKTLKQGEAAIEFVHYNYYTPNLTGRTIYGALLLRYDDEQPHFVPLFDEEELELLLKREERNKKQYYNRLYSFEDTRVNLYSLIYQPLDTLLGQIEKIYVSPSGLLHRINLGAIQIDHDQTFSDRYQLLTLGSTRQLVVKENTLAKDVLTAAVYGGIQYNIDTVEVVRVKEKTTNEERGRSWEYLPGTEKEAKEVAGIIAGQAEEVCIYQGREATEESFKKWGVKDTAPDILHLATHGYFYPDVEKEKQGIPAFNRKLAFKISDHSMIRSGLIMAGGNHVWLGNRPMQGREDGILTAYEVSQLNLHNTKLAVLSACETGLGDIKGDEGVYGLQRAFKIAGVQRLIMSLWSVPDEQTQQMMTNFYDLWLNETLSIHEAFYMAQQEMRKKYKDHYYWAAFVLIE